MDNNLIAIVLVVAVGIGAVLFIRSRVKRAKGPSSPGRKPFGVDTHEH